MAQNAEEQRTAAYVAWGTFRNQLDSLARNGIPNRIDRSAFIGLAGGTQTQLVHAMRFLDLVDEQGNPTALLKEAVSKEEPERKKALEGAFREAYADLFALNLEKATPDQFLETLEKSYKVTGSTRRKAATFFLKGAKWLGIGVSPFLEKAGKAAAKAAGTNGSPRLRKSKKPQRAALGPPAAAGTSKTVSLVSGGSLTVSADLDLFSLNADDRKFIFGLIDQLEGYEKTLKAADEGAEEETEADDAAEEGGPS